MERETENRVIELAMAKGLLSPRAVARALEAARGAEDIGGAPAPGDVLGWLVRLGELEAGNLARLRREVDEGEPTHVTPPGAVDPAAEDSTKSAAQSTRLVHAGPARPIDISALAGWNRYELIALLGRGGMGEVFKAWDPRLKRHVALKFLYRENIELTARFLQEAQAQARVEHEGICKVYEVGEAGGRPFIAMQLIAGETLAVAGKTLSTDEKTRVMRLVAEALHAAHRSGLVHRDLKPGNIMVERSEDGVPRPFILDFGLAREIATEGITITGAVMGTPAYMSPEQAQGQVHALDRRADVYALGATLYDLLCGRPPFVGRNSIETLLLVIRGDPPPLRRLAPDLPADLETIVMKCLERDPGRRYESARAFAEDLARFGDGDPILARPASVVYRARKRLRKHPLASCLLAVALGASLLLGGVVLRERWRAAAQSHLAEELNQEISSLQQLMRYATLAPAHDIRQEKNVVRERLRLLGQRVDEAGDIGLGPGAFAVGRGHLLLGQPEEARRYLQEAWDAGYRGAPAAHALGEAYGALYQKALENVERIANTQTREKRRKEAETTYREPALRFLAQARDAHVDTTGYLDARMAFYEKRWPEALEGARRAAAGATWLYEARRLEADVYLAIGFEKEQAGDESAARAQFEQAIAVYRVAAEVGRSDPALPAGECNAWAQIMNMAILRGGAARESLERATAACDRALAADPEHAPAHSTRSVLFWRWSEYEADHGGDPAPFIDRAVEAAELAMRHDPASDKGPLNLGTSFWRKAEYERSRGLDPRASLERAIEAYRRALDLNPNLEAAVNNLGLAYWTLGEDEGQRNLDPRSSFGKAVESFRATIRINPKQFFAYSNIAGVLSQQSSYEWRHGVDPIPSLDQAIASAGQAIELNPKFVHARVNLANSLLLKGQRQLQQNVNPKATLETAVAGFRKAIELDPGNALALTNLGVTFRTLAELDASQGRDPGPAIEAAVESARRSLEANPRYAGGERSLAITQVTRATLRLDSGRDPTVALGEARAALRRAAALGGPHHEIGQIEGSVELLSGRWAARRGLSPLAHWAAARTSLERSLQLNAGNVNAYLLRAEIGFCEGEWLAARGKDPSPALADGRVAATRATEIDGSQQTSAVLVAAMEVVEARVTGSPEHRRELASRARTGLEASLDTDQRLRRRWAPLLDEAKRLAGPG